MFLSTLSGFSNRAKFLNSKLPQKLFNRAINRMDTSKIQVTINIYQIPWFIIALFL